MKKFKIVSLLMVLAVMLFGGIITANAATSLPDSVVSDVTGTKKGLREVEYIKNWPVIMKTADNGKYYIYCMNMSATYAPNVKFNKTGVVDDGYLFILNTDLGLTDKDLDFYIKQNAVWYYEDYLSGTDFNLIKEVKDYIVSNVETDQVARMIYNLYRGAKTYKQYPGALALEDKNISFTIQDGYYVSSKITVYQSNLTGDLKYNMTNVPAGSKIVKSGEDGIKIKIPASAIPEGKQLTFTLNVEGSYKKYSGYYYYHSDNYQKMLFQHPLETILPATASLKMVIKHYKQNEDFDINISKTDVTQSKEVAGAKLEVKDATGKLIDSWVSTNETHKITLKSGEYSLTETIAPKGYKLSKTTIYFMVDDIGGLFVKDQNGNYVSVNRVVMINELIDVISVAKKDSRTGDYVSGAKLVIKDDKGNVVKEFITNDTVYQLSLEEGKYTLSEVSAPVGYLLSSEVVHFEVLSDGTLKIMNNNGEYVDSALITFYNTPETSSEINVDVPATGKNATLLVIGGIALLIGGIACAKKTIKEC